MLLTPITAHRLLVEKGILHRDISWGNILVDPVHFTAGDGVQELTHTGFIDGILGVGTNPHAVLNDLDNATLTDPPASSGEPVRGAGSPTVGSAQL